MPPTEEEAKAEQKQVEEIEQRSNIGAHIVLAAVRKEGEEELDRSSSNLAWSAIAAGLSMGLSFLAESLLRSHMPDAEWRPLITKFGYCVGFLVVVLGRQQLYTENTLTVILPLLAKPKIMMLLRVLRLWTVVLCGNLAGTYLFALFFAKSGVFTGHIQSVMGDVAREDIPTAFATVLLKGILAGWLIALMVWLLPAAETARVSVIVILTYLVGLGSFAHIIAGSTKVMYAAIVGATSWGTYFGHFMVPALLGNIIGGVTLVAALGHAQVKSGEDEEKE